MKIIAFYLPQFHNIPENDEWWGDGFTEWVNVKKARPLFEGHRQPKVPLNNNYYDLLDDDVKIWQAKIAKEHGIYGFCYYHYWFNGKLLLEKPMEQMLANPKIDISFCISWANEAWTKAWVAEEKKVLIPQYYGSEKEWKEHFDYLLPFFKDPRYIKKDNKPLMIIYRPTVIPCGKEMLTYWNRLAVDAGLEGLCFAYQTGDMDWTPVSKDEINVYDYDIEFQPGYARQKMFSEKKGLLTWIKRLRVIVAAKIEKKFGINILRYGMMRFQKITHSNRISYDKAWETIINSEPVRSNSIPGAFVHWDNSPRHGDRAVIYTGDTPEKFEHYMTEQIKNAREKYNEDMIFIYAWNEWAEGGFLEPDEENGYAYLEAIKKALELNNEFPW